MGQTIERQDHGRVIELKLSRPGSGNAFNTALVAELHATLDEIKPESCETVVFRGEGKGFCGGLDLSDMAQETDSSLLGRLVQIELLLQRIARLPQNTVAMVHRFAFGAGADLFLACRYRMAAPGTRFAFPGVRFGIALGTGRLAQLVGPDTARQLLASSIPISLEDMQEAGAVQQVLDTEDWPAFIAKLDATACSFDARMSQIIAARLDPGTDDTDLAALVRSAAEPGLKNRIAAYAERIAAERKH